MAFNNVKVNISGFTQYPRTQNAAGEEVIAGSYQGNQIKQTIPTNGQTGIILFSTADLNFVFIPVEGIPEGYQFVELVAGVNAVARQG
jgi:histidinol-phosphate/aromatic aminotransferase/cobyric acid decarboxylase-like protein